MRAVHPRSPWVLAVGCVAALSLVAGCSSAPEPQSVAMMSEVRPAADDGGAGGSELPDLGTGTDDLGLDDLGLDQLQDLFDELEGAFGAEELDDLFEGMSPEDLGIDPDELGLAGIDGCFEQLMLYSQLMVAALGMGGAGSTERISSELREQLPPELHDDLDVITRSMEGASFSDLVSGTGPLASREFQRANEAVAQWLATDCNADGA